MLFPSLHGHFSFVASLTGFNKFSHSLQQIAAQLSVVAIYKFGNSQAVAKLNHQFLFSLVIKGRL